MCGLCFGFFEGRYISRHQNICKINSSKIITSLPITLIQPISNVAITDDFKMKILAKFRVDAVGKICQTDPTIVTVGLRLYDKMKRKLDKETEVRKSVRTDMRRLAHLYNEFKVLPDIVSVNENSMDLFNRVNYFHLCDAISNYTTTKDNKVKSGLKVSLIYLIKTAALILKGTVLTQSLSQETSSEENTKKALDAANEIDLFLSVFNHMQDFVFGDAHYTLNKNRQVRLRKPCMLPMEEDVKTLKEFVVSRMKEIVAAKFEYFDYHRYVELRDAACTRLTLLNGRRGGEVSSNFFHSSAM